MNGMRPNCNVVVVFDQTHTKVLLCHRQKDPYKGLYNFIGGKLEPGEAGETAAYRELYEETGIFRAQIQLTHLMDFTYHYLGGFRLEVWFGYLQEPVAVHGTENELLWMDRAQDWFDMTRFAGEGNMGHVMEEISYWEQPVHSSAIGT